MTKNLAMPGTENMTKCTFPSITRWFPSVPPYQEPEVVLVGELGGSWRCPCILLSKIRSPLHQAAQPESGGGKEVEGPQAPGRVDFLSPRMYQSQESLPSKGDMETQTMLPHRHQPTVEDTQGGAVFQTCGVFSDGVTYTLTRSLPGLRRE